MWRAIKLWLIDHGMLILNGTKNDVVVWMLIQAKLEMHGFVLQECFEVPHFFAFTFEVNSF